MQVDYNVPFFSNTPDQTHCYQAVLKMGLKFFWPEREFGWKELEKITAKAEGLWTWQAAGMLWLKRNGFEVVLMEDFDNERFIEMGGEYLIERSGKEVGEKQIANSDIAQEIKLVKELVREVKIIKKIPDRNNVKELLTNSFLVICNVNSRTLNNREGFSGHFVLVKGFDEGGFILHDPGFPGTENRKVSFELFEKAWAYPVEHSKNIMAFKLIDRFPV